MRGAGGSNAPAGGYDKKTLAGDVYGLLAQLGLDDEVSVVGHDIGTMVAYAYAAAHRDHVRRLVLTEAPIPDQSLYQAPSLTPNGPGFWNFGFFSLPNGLPEQIVDGREALWVDRFTDSMEVQKTGIDDDDVREYARHLQDDAHLRASFDYFRALPQDVADNAEHGNRRRHRRLRPLDLRRTADRTHRATHGISRVRIPQHRPPRPRRRRPHRSTRHHDPSRVHRHRQPRPMQRHRHPRRQRLGMPPRRPPRTLRPM
ncbi:alpha/beta fold hydrolase [Polymorphospora rubra]|uniref:alpha/beta fold hydrolase n=1 Tax=Polymorphospora rubra TaxID=338584 RepID=UPI003F4D14B0